MNTKTAKNIRIIDFLNALGHEPQRTIRYNYFYYSPFRTEKTASMKVDDKLNLWYDHGSAQGGTIIDLIIAMQKAINVSEALTFLKGLNLNTDFVFNNMREKIGNQNNTRESSIKIEKIQSLHDSKLLHYLKERNINIDTARKYLQEIHYSVDDRKYKALGWLDNNGSYHLRSEFFKGCTSQNISVVDGSGCNQENTICMVYEGMFDFLSHLTLKNEKQFKVDCIILNSLSNLNKAIEWIRENKLTPSLILDNDAAGQKATSKLLKEFPEAKDFSVTYSDHKDLNDYLKSKNILNNNLANDVDESRIPEQANTYRRKR
ncbi:Toprim-like [Cruoricaptor ignavus]|uniref:Toprim-like n=2 Tax=Cruoricaptor ignavus TaxID=1118202 RepID=A0A1M6E7J4_9FLAO|nr:Toprim-like [Cruoricaptor ignavus]